MTYNPGTPLPQDIPADSQDEFLTNFDELNEIYGINHIPFGNTIVSATTANPCVMVSPNHRLTSGDSITLYTLDGLNAETGKEPWPINGNTYAGANLTVIDANSFSINQDTSTFDPYIESSGNFLCNEADYGYGMHKFINFAQKLTAGPGRAAPLSALYTRQVERQSLNYPFDKITQTSLYFQNNVANEYQLTNNTIINETGSIKGYGWRTPWGTIINFWNWQSFGANSPATVVVSLPIPYSTTHYFTLVTPIIRGNLRVTAKTLTDFTVAKAGSGPSNGHTFSYLSMGK